MANVAISGDTSGAVTLTVPATAGTQTVTFPAASGTAMVSGNMPAFSAYLGSNQTVSANTWTKVQCNTKEFDTATAYDATTNYRFTPQVAGYYQVSGSVGYSGANGTCTLQIYKNGSAFKQGQQISTVTYYLTVSALVYCNGSTDYIELYAYTPSTVFAQGLNNTYFQASMVRGA